MKSSKNYARDAQEAADEAEKAAKRAADAETRYENRGRRAANSATNAITSATPAATSGNIGEIDEIFDSIPWPSTPKPISKNWWVIPAALLAAGLTFGCLAIVFRLTGE
jgi:hypothetical protein